MCHLDKGSMALPWAYPGFTTALLWKYTAYYTKEAPSKEGASLFLEPQRKFVCSLLLYAILLWIT